MAELKVFSVYDSKAKAFLPPFFLPNDAVAVRVFSDCANDKSHQFGRFPNDYSLFAIGCFFDDSGDIQPISPLQNLGLASSFVVTFGSEVVK